MKFWIFDNYDVVEIDSINVYIVMDKLDKKYEVLQ